MIHLDTHAAVWLAGGLASRMPGPTLERIANEDTAVSPMVRLELAYLHEIGRITQPADAVLGELRRSIGTNEDLMSFGDVITIAERMTWTRDPFDRVIAAHAIASSALLATSDRRIRGALPEHTLWD